MSDLRTDYQRGELNETALPGTPLAVFERWLGEALAAGAPEPTAMTLATVGEDGRPSTRVVLLKSADADGLVFYTNYHSRKARQLDRNPYAAAQFHWVEAERVVRVEGRVAKVAPEQSDAYFVTRPLDSRIGAWASPQSEPIASRAVLLANAARVSARYGLNPPRPDHWGGFRLAPDRWEFWQGRVSRLHDRVCYLLEGGQWVRRRLAP